MDDGVYVVNGLLRILSPSSDLCGAALRIRLSPQAHNLELDGRPVWRDESALEMFVVDGGSPPVSSDMETVTVR